MITHWDEVDGVRRERGHIAASWQSLTGAHSVTVGVQRISIDPGRWATPLHLEGSEEEIFFVLSGTGVSVQWDGEKEEAFAVGAGRLSRSSRARARAHDRRRRRRASSCSPSGSATTPRTRCCRGPASRGSARRGCSRERRTTTRGRERPPSARRRGTSWRSGRARIVNVADVDEPERVGATVARACRDLGRAAGSERTGLRLYDVDRRASS